MTKTDMGFVILGTGCLLLAAGMEYQAHQDKKTQAITEQNGVSPARWKKLDNTFNKRADQLLDQHPRLEDPHWGITGGRMTRQGDTFFIELNVGDAPAYQGTGGPFVRQMFPYTHPNTLALFFGEKGLCQKPLYRSLNRHVTIRYNFESYQETKVYTRSLRSLCGWTNEIPPDNAQRIKNKQLADFAFLNATLRKGFFLTDTVSQGYQIYVHTTLDKALIPSIHFTVTTLSDRPGMLSARSLWPHIRSHAFCEQLQQFDKLPLTLYAHTHAASALTGNLATQTVDQICPR